MKKMFTTLTLSLLSTAAFAHPGGHTLTCKSAKNSGSAQAVQFTLQRSNGTGWYAATYSVSVNGKQFSFEGEDESKNLGETIHDSPLGVIIVTADNWSQEKATRKGSFSVVAIPRTVKALDASGKPARWT